MLLCGAQLTLCPALEDQTQVKGNTMNTKTKTLAQVLEDAQRWYSEREYKAYGDTQAAQVLTELVEALSFTDGEVPASLTM